MDHELPNIVLSFVYSYFYEKEKEKTLLKKKVTSNNNNTYNFLILNIKIPNLYTLKIQCKAKTMKFKKYLNTMQ